MYRGRAGESESQYTNRRQFLLIAASTAGLAGCTSTEPAGEGETGTTKAEKDGQLEGTVSESTESRNRSESETQSPSELVELQSTSFTETDDGHVLRGEVENVSNVELADVTVSANFYDKDNRLIFERWDAVPFLEPDQSYLLRIPYVEGHADAEATAVERYELEKSVMIDPLTEKNDGQVNVEDHSLKQTESGLRVEGELKNITETTLTRVYPTVNFYDSDGTVISTYNDGASDLGPEEIFPFEVPYLDRHRPPSSAVSGYKLVVQVQM